MRREIPDTKRTDQPTHPTLCPRETSQSLSKSSRETFSGRSGEQEGRVRRNRSERWRKPETIFFLSFSLSSLKWFHSSPMSEDGAFSYLLFVEEAGDSFLVAFAEGDFFGLSNVVVKTLKISGRGKS
jgi:hypothetical protein